MTGFIYKIVNDVNNKIYIGQTVQNPSKRLQGHINDAFIIDYSKMDYKYNHKFARALRKYGPEHFEMIIIEECDIEKLNEKEVYYINKYNSFENGYNTTLGGEGTSTIKFNDAEIEFIIKAYKEQKLSIVNIAKSLGVSTNTIKTILNRYNVEIRESVFESKRVVMYDKQFNPIHIFNSKKEIVEWLANNTEYAINLQSIYGLVTRACQKGNTAYGFRWQLFLDLQCDNKVFRTKFDKEAYLQGERAYIPEGKDYWVVDNSLNKLKLPKEKIEITKQKHCSYCNKVIDINRRVCDECKKQKRANYVERYKEDYKLTTSKLTCSVCGCIITRNSTTGMCNICANKLMKSNGKPDKPSKDELKKLLNEYTQKEIAQMYQRSTGTISYWLKYYGLR